MTKLSVKNLDHLGIIATIVDELGIVDYINEQLQENDRAEISAGLVVKAMILNGLGFTHSPLYLFSQFFEDKPLEHLLGKGVKASYLNDDRLGRVLDLIFMAGISRLFIGICLRAVEIFKIMMRSSHLDSSSLSEEKDVHANHVEAFNSAIRRYLAAFRRRINTYAKSVVGLQRVLDIFWMWMVHNFVRSHFTTREVPAVALGIIEKGLTWEDLLQIRLIS
jgi:hypothetical protein